jgi:hypothetical protein
MVNVTNRSDVDMRLGSFKCFLGHRSGFSRSCFRLRIRL